MIRIKADELWFCTDCFYVSETGDETALDYHHGEQSEQISEKIHAGIERLQSEYNGQLHANCDGETGNGIDDFSTSTCDCCLTNLTGKRFRMLILGGK